MEHSLEKMKNIGGQAVIEGVMMKAPRGWTVAVRDQKGDIHCKAELLDSLPQMLRLPLVRGVTALYQAFSIGIKALQFSAHKAYQEEEGNALSPFAMVSTIGFAILIAIGLFIFLPLYITKIIGMLLSILTKSSFLFNLTDGVIRVIIFLLYLVSVGLWKDMRRIFEYHGAEHKVIHAYEAGRPLNVVNVKSFSPHHPRCGTSFLLIVMVVSIFLFSLIPQSWPFSGKFLSRLIFIPVIAGLSYEILRLSAKSKGNSLVSLLVLPGLMLQKLTTREPDDLQLEVALVAMREVLKFEEGYDPET